MYPAAADRIAPIANPIAVWTPQHQQQQDQDDDPDNADRGILPVQVRARPLLHSRRDFLHPAGSGVGGKNLPAGDQTIDQRRQAADYDQQLCRTHSGVPLLVDSFGRDRSADSGCAEAPWPRAYARSASARQIGDYHFVNDRVRLQLGNVAGLGEKGRNFWIRQ